MNHDHLVKLVAKWVRQNGSPPQVAVTTPPMLNISVIPDIFAIRASITHPITTVYEIKVSRNDFCQEVKKEKYLKSFAICNLFYFVCPEGMIQDWEVPNYCGLAYWIPKGRCRERLEIVKRAKGRKIWLTRETVLQCLFMQHRKRINYIVGKQRKLFWKGE